MANHREVKPIGKVTKNRPFGEKCSRPHIKITEIDGNRYCHGYINDMTDEIMSECLYCKKSTHHKDFEKAVIDNMASKE